MAARAVPSVGHDVCVGGIGTVWAGADVGALDVVFVDDVCVCCVTGVVACVDEPLDVPTVPVGTPQAVSRVSSKQPISATNIRGACDGVCVFIG